MAFWIMALVYIVGTVLYEVLRPKPQFDAPTPSSLGDFQFPTSRRRPDHSRRLGDLQTSSGPMVTWYGDLRIQAIKEKVKTGAVLLEGDHHRLQVLPRHPISAMQRRDRRSPADPVRRQTPFGQLRSRSGPHPDQHQCARAFSAARTQKVASKAASTSTAERPPSRRTPTSRPASARVCPAWRRVCYAVFRRVYLGTSPYIKAVSFVVRRCPNGLGSHRRSREHRRRRQPGGHDLRHPDLAVFRERPRATGGVPGCGRISLGGADARRPKVSGSRCCRIVAPPRRTSSLRFCATSTGSCTWNRRPAF